MTQSLITSPLHSSRKNLNPLQLEGLKREKLEELRAALHETVDAMLARVDFDQDGDAINTIDAVRVDVALKIPAMNEIYASIPITTRLVLQIGPSFRGVRAHVKGLEEGDMVRSALSNAGTHAAQMVSEQQERREKLEEQDDPPPPPEAFESDEGL